MSQVVGTVNAAGPVVKTRRDQTTYTLNEVTIDGQVYVARKDVCGIAQTMAGQRVEAIVRVEQKGDYTNYYLDFIQLAGGSSAPGMQAAYNPAQAAQQAQQQVQPQQVQAQPSGLQPQPVQLIPGYTQQPQQASDWRDQAEREKKTSIHRQTAGKVAGLISKTPQDFWANVAALVRFFETGETPNMGTPAAYNNAPPDQAKQNAAAYTQFPPQEQQQFVPASAYADTPPPHTDDDIPF